MNDPLWVWQQPNWPHFNWQADALAPLLRTCSQAQGRLLGMLGAAVLTWSGTVAGLSEWLAVLLLPLTGFFVGLSHDLRHVLRKITAQNEEEAKALMDSIRKIEDLNTDLIDRVNQRTHELQKTNHSGDWFFLSSWHHATSPLGGCLFRARTINAARVVFPTPGLPTSLGLRGMSSSPMTSHAARTCVTNSSCPTHLIFT